MWSRDWPAGFMFTSFVKTRRFILHDECGVGGPDMQQISVIGDARVCPDDLGRQLAGLFQIEFQLLHEALDATPKRHTLIDIDLHDGPQLALLKDWLKGKPQNADVIFA